jgi:hypothetical protein
MVKIVIRRLKNSICDTIEPLWTRLCDQIKCHIKHILLAQKLLFFGLAFEERKSRIQKCFNRILAK